MSRSVRRPLWATVFLCLITQAACLQTDPELESADALQNWCITVTGYSEIPGLCESEWQAAYFQFTNANWNQLAINMPVTTRLPFIRQGSHAGEIPFPMQEHFSARYSRAVYLPGGDYTFRVTSDDGVRIILLPIQTIQFGGYLVPADPMLGLRNTTTLPNSRYLIPPNMHIFDSPIAGTVVVDEWRQKAASEVIPNTTRAVEAGFYMVVVEYFEHEGLEQLVVDISLTSNPPPITVCATEQWTVDYFNNESWAGDYVARECLDGEDVQRTWVDGGDVTHVPVSVVPVPYGVQNQYFTARLTRTFTEAGRYNLAIKVDDLVRIFVNDSMVFERTYPTGAAPQSLQNLNIPANAVVRIDYWQRPLDAYLDVDFERIYSDDSGRISLHCAIPWQQDRPNYYRVIRRNAQGGTTVIRRAGHDHDAWAALDNKPFGIDVPIQGQTGANGQLFDIELWLDNQLRATRTIRAFPQQNVDSYAFCNALDSYPGVVQWCPEDQGFNPGSVCAPGRDNCCEASRCAIPETSPGGICDPHGDGLDNDSSEGINWDAGWYCYERLCGH